MNALAPHLNGGHFLLADTPPADVFTPEDLSTEERQIIDTAEKFMDKEVLPRIEALEHQSRECVHTPALHMILIATPAREVLAPQKVGDREYRLPWDRQQTVPPRNALEFGERALGFVEVFEYLGADDEV